MEIFRGVKEELIADICGVDVKTAFELYNLSYHLIKDYKIILADPNGSITPGYAVNHTFSGGATIQSLFKSKKVLVLDKKTLEEMKTGKSEFQIDYSISLETQALSYLEPYISPMASKSRIPQDFEEVFGFIVSKNVNVDPQPYIIENLKNLKDTKNHEKIYKKLMAYEVLRTINVDAFNQDKVISTTLTRNELMIKTDEHFNSMLNNYDVAGIQSIYDIYNLGYICLLKMVIIQLKQSVIDNIRKMKQFIGFCDKYLGIIPLRDTITAHKYFKEGQKFKFFSKIQKNKDDLILNLKNMAWDIYHIRSMENAFRSIDFKNSRYFFPALLTFDKGMIELMQLYPLRAIAFNNEGALYPFFDGDFKQYIEESFLKEIYSFNAKASRNFRRNELREPSKIDELIISLEAELLA